MLNQIISTSDRKMGIMSFVVCVIAVFMVCAWCADSFGGIPYSDFSGNWTGTRTRTSANIQSYPLTASVTQSGANVTAPSSITTTWDNPGDLNIPITGTVSGNTATLTGAFFYYVTFTASYIGVLNPDNYISGTYSITSIAASESGTFELTDNACPLVKLVSTSKPYVHPQGAYDAAGEEDTVQMYATSFNENLTLDDTKKSVKLQGGFGCDFNNNSSWTTITGVLTLGGGPVTVENLILKTITY
jgi:hypothetical protein